MDLSPVTISEAEAALKILSDYEHDEAPNKYEGALEAGIKRLASVEAFTLSRSLDPIRDAELIARIDFARALIASQGGR